MPTPLGHSLAGLAVYAIGAKQEPPQTLREKIGMAALLVAVSNAPDLDFFSLSENGPVLSGRFHHGLTHSAGFALVTAGLLWLWARIRGYEKANGLFVLTFMAYSLHVVTDLFNVDSYTLNGIGLPALWPFTDRYYILPFMPGVDRSAPFSPGTIWAVFVEVAVYGAAALAAFAWRFRGGIKKARR